MTDTSLFFSTRPAYPWSVYPIGLPALGVVAALLVLFTVWTYLGHPQATRKRVLTILGLRLLALLVALVTAVRPSVGVQEEPKVPSVLLIGVDLSESMTVKDEVNNQARIDAVRKVLEKCQQTLDELAADQNVTVVVYGFSTPDFNPDTSRYDPQAPADGKRSDYGTYLNKTYEKWQTERFVRGHILIGDGADNGSAFSAPGEAGRWGRRNVPLATFTVGSQDTPGEARDVVVAGLAHDPSVPIKNDITFTATVHAYNYEGARVQVRVFFNDTLAHAQDAVLARQKDNRVPVTVKAPATAGEVRVRFEVGREGEGGKLEPLPGEVSGANNSTESYLTVTKEGVRVLVIDRLRPERGRVLDALRPEKVVVDGKEVERKRFDVVQVVRQSTRPPTPEDAQFLDLDAQGYDVVVIGNVSYEELVSASPQLPEKIVDRVVNKGMGVMFLGGEDAYTGYPPAQAGDPTDRPTTLAGLLPVVPSPRVIVETRDKDTGRIIRTYQTVPTDKGLDDSVMKVDKDPAKARELWDRLNLERERARITGYNKFEKKPAASVYAWASNERDVVAAGTPALAVKGDPLLVGYQFGQGKAGRVLTFAAFDTYLWERAGQPKTRLGVEVHSRFWKQCLLWLAHQEEEEGQAYARPEFRRLPVGGDQTIRVGLKSPTGGDDPNAELVVKVLPPGQDKSDDEAKAPPQTVLKDKAGSKVLFKPPAPGEYTVVVTAPMKDAAGNPVPGPDGKPARHRGTARFIAYPDVSDEMIRVAADHGFFEKLTAASGGRALRLEDLPGFLKDLKGQSLETIRPKPRYLPDWRRNHSGGFLPGWLVLFAALLGVEWGLRRLWGMV